MGSSPIWVVKARTYLSDNIIMLVWRNCQTPRTSHPVGGDTRTGSIPVTSIRKSHAKHGFFYADKDGENFDGTRGHIVDIRTA